MLEVGPVEAWTQMRRSYAGELSITKLYYPKVLWLQAKELIFCAASFFEPVGNSF